MLDSNPRKPSSACSRTDTLKSVSTFRLSNLTELGFERVVGLALNPGDILLRIGVQTSGKGAERLCRDHVVRDAERILLRLIGAGEEAELVAIHRAEIDAMLLAVVQTRTCDAGKLTCRVTKAGADLGRERVER